MRGPVDISFVIPVRDDAVRLQRCLRSIADNRYPLGQIEVIVVDNGSSDNSPAVARESGARVLAAPGLRVAAMRNLGAAEAKAPVLAFVDADHVLRADWIASALDTLSKSSRIAAAGDLCHAPPDGTWVQRSYDRLRSRRGGRHEVDWLGAGNLVVRRSAFEQIGGFDVTLETCEDVDLCKKLRHAGFRLWADDRMHNVHIGDPATLGALFRGELWRGRNNLAVSFRKPITAGELPSALIPMVHLSGIVVAALSSAVGGVAGLTAASVALTPLALAPVARALRMTRNAPDQSIRTMIDNTAVAFVYDLARALALVAFARHGVRRR
jgi:GT2 family glycosyltransferase